jgi:hypothetical protein
MDVSCPFHGIKAVENMSTSLHSWHMVVLQRTVGMAFRKQVIMY